MSTTRLYKVHKHPAGVTKYLQFNQDPTIDHLIQAHYTSGNETTSQSPAVCNFHWSRDQATDGELIYTSGANGGRYLPIPPEFTKGGPITPFVLPDADGIIHLKIAYTTPPPSRSPNPSDAELESSKRAALREVVSYVYDSLSPQKVMLFGSACVDIGTARDFNLAIDFGSDRDPKLVWHAASLKFMSYKIDIIDYQSNSMFLDSIRGDEANVFLARDGTAVRPEKMNHNPKLRSEMAVNMRNLDRIMNDIVKMNLKMSLPDNNMKLSATASLFHFWTHLESGLIRVLKSQGVHLPEGEQGEQSHMRLCFIFCPSLAPNISTDSPNIPSHFLLDYSGHHVAKALQDLCMFRDFYVKEYSNDTVDDGKLIKLIGEVSYLHQAFGKLARHV